MKRRTKKYLETDVLTEARKRMRHMYDVFDHVVVQFSGGKDSLVVLELAHEVMEERGLKHVDVVFRDEELIPDQVIDFVNHYREQPWVKMLYLCIPLRSQKYILGRSFDYIQWDPDREHIRPIPPHGITLPPGDRRVFDQYNADRFIAHHFPGKKAFLLGLRAEESLMRYQGMMRKLDEPYIQGSAAGKDICLCKPIYDWSENDVFKYFYDNKLRYAALYDAQHLAGGALRVSTPLHAESAKNIGRLREIAPVFYNQVLRLFPEMAVQERYWDEMDRQALVVKWGQSFEGIRSYIDDQISDEVQHEKALAVLDEARKKHDREPERFPVEYVFKYIMNGAFKRKLMAKVA